MASSALCPVCSLPPESGEGAAMKGRCSRCGVSLESPQTPEALFAEVASLARRDRLIDAIRYYRGLTGEGLKEAKDAVELIASGGTPRLSPKALQELTGASPNDSLPPAQRAELEQLLLAGKKIEAIRRHRELTRSGLKESKDAVEALEATLQPSSQALPFPGDAHRSKGSNTVVWVVLAFVLGLLVAWLFQRG